MIRRPMVGVATLVLMLAGCGYFNSLYNARRQFADAERARARGELGTARQAYSGSIEKAAKSFRKYPSGRWADDALYLIARARFRLGEYAPARAAFTELLARTGDREIRSGAHAYAGATELRLLNSAAALVHLDTALVELDRNHALHGFARLWRARAHVGSGNLADAWADLDAVESVDDREYSAVQLERIALALNARDSTHFEHAIQGLLASHDVRQRLDTLDALASAAAPWLGASAVRSMLVVKRGDWPAAARDSLALMRARIAAHAHDTLTANRELLDLASNATAVTAAVARVMIARSRLQVIEELEALNDIRALLLPAITSGQAQQLIRTIRLVDVMVRRSAATGQPLALFAAAEVARDELGAPRLARTLFTAYADLGAQSPWAAKALLAAIALEPVAPDAHDLRARLFALPTNPYSQVVRGEAAQEAYETAEQRLTRSLIALRSEAIQLAQQEETVVTRAIAVLDSITAAARADTVRAACGMLIDTLAITGIRADSVRTACIRSDSVNVAAYLTIDTASWRPGSRDDSLRVRRRGGRNARDTIIK